MVFAVSESFGSAFGFVFSFCCCFSCASATCLAIIVVAKDSTAAALLSDSASPCSTTGGCCSCLTPPSSPVDDDDDDDTATVANQMSSRWATIDCKVEGFNRTTLIIVIRHSRTKTDPTRQPERAFAAPLAVGEDEDDDSDAVGEVILPEYGVKPSVISLPAR